MIIRQVSNLTPGRLQHSPLLLQYLPSDHSMSRPMVKLMANTRAKRLRPITSVKLRR